MPIINDLLQKSSVSSKLPVHGEPPNCSGGSLFRLRLIVLPTVSQKLHSPHLPQRQSTKEQKSSLVMVKNLYIIYKQFLKLLINYNICMHCDTWTFFKFAFFCSKFLTSTRSFIVLHDFFGAKRRSCSCAAIFRAFCWIRYPVIPLAIY